MNFNFNVLYEYREMFLHGAITTLWIAAVATLGGTVLGLIGALARLCRFEKAGFIGNTVSALVRGIANLYVTVIRGTPLFVQVLFWAYVGLVAFVHHDGGWILSGQDATDFRRGYGAITAGVLALTINSGAYITEVFRGGIQSIDKGQMEAARSLGLTYMQAMRYIIVPQALRRMLPPLANEFITLLKDSSLLSVIGVAELVYVQKTISGRYTIYKEPLVAISLIYLAMTLCLVWLFSYLEKKYSTNRPR